MTIRKIPNPELALLNSVKDRHGVLVENRMLQLCAAINRKDQEYALQTFFIIWNLPVTETMQVRKYLIRRILYLATGFCYDRDLVGMIFWVYNKPRISDRAMVNLIAAMCQSGKRGRLAVEWEALKDPLGLKIYGLTKETTREGLHDTALAAYSRTPMLDFRLSRYIEIDHFKHENKPLKPFTDFTPIDDEKLLELQTTFPEVPLKYTKFPVKLKNEVRDRTEMNKRDLFFATIMNIS